MRTVVAGGCVLLGSHFVRSFENPDLEVIAVDIELEKE